MTFNQNILVACDNIVLNPDQKILLIRRGSEPFKGMWALPGGFAEEDEDLSETAARELMEETGIKVNPEDMFQVGTYGKPGRDPRGRTVSVVYSILLDKHVAVKGGDDAADAEWFSLQIMPELAFDHEEILTNFLDMMLDFMNDLQQ